MAAARYSVPAHAAEKRRKSRGRNTAPPPGDVVAGLDETRKQKVGADNRGLSPVVPSHFPRTGTGAGEMAGRWLTISVSCYRS